MASRLIFYTLEQIYDFDPKRLRNQMETCQSDVHPAVLERANLRSMKA